ncbi:MAG: MATE family efflux transporter [Acidimicrobiia bacterium]
MSTELRTAFRRNPRDRAIVVLALPALGTLAIDPVVTIVDTAWVGRLGTAQLAALAIAGAVFAAVFSVFNFVQVTITPLIAGEVARGKLGKAGRIATGSMWIAVALGAGLGFVFIALTPAITNLFGADPTVGSEAMVYLRIRFVSLPLLLLTTVGHGVYRGHQNTTTPLWVAVGMNIVNLILDPLLIFGLGLGIAGAAWATVIAHATAAVWFLVLILGVDRVKLGVGLLRGKLESLPVGDVLHAGWPMIVRSLALLGAITATTFAASRIGTAETAAHQVALQVWLFLAFVLDSYAIAAQAMIGSDFGTRNIAAARSLANRLLALGVITGIGLSVMLVISAPLLPILFDLQPAVESLLSDIYIFVIVLQPLTALVYVWDGVGIGASAFRYLAVSMVVAGIATVICLVAFGDSLVGVWASLGVLTLVRLFALAGWHRWGPLGVVRDPSPASRGA